MGAQQHQSNSRTLDRRTLSNDHRCLAHLLRPGMAVLDVGCGTGAITLGIAEAVGPAGIAVGIDRDAELIARAKAHSPSTPHLHFARADIVDSCFQSRFDIVTAARTLQWIEDLPRAITGMARAAKLGGRLVVLDYNHTFNRWQPDPPEVFTVFYEAFLAWRRSHGWSNEMGHQLPGLFTAAGLFEIHAAAQDATSQRGDQDFAAQTSIWTDVIDNLGPTLTASGFCNRERLTEARRVYEQWRMEKLRVQTLSMTCVVAKVP